MNKQDLATIIAHEHGITIREATNRIDQVFNAVSQQLYQNDVVKIRNFGTFKVVERKPKTMKNPRTGESIEVPARNVPVFSSSQALEDAVKKRQ